MKLKLDFVKDLEGSHTMQMVLDVVGQETASFVVPLGKDLLYAIYKGISLELKHLDCKLSEYGEKALAYAKAAGVADGVKEETSGVEGSLPAATQDPIHPA